MIKLMLWLNNTFDRPMRCCYPAWFLDAWFAVAHWTYEWLIAKGVYQRPEPFDIDNFVDF